MPTLFELITANCDKHPTAVALGRPDGPFLDHVSLHCIVVAMGDTLRSIGVERGDRIALSLPDALHAAVAFLAVATHAVCAPMNPRYRRGEIEFHLTDLGISALVVPDDEDPPALDAAAQLGVSILRLVCDERGLPVALRPDRIVVQRCIKNSGGTDLALLLHTSGTTARPKIVPLSHANLITSSRNIARSLALTPHDRCLNVMPLFHLHGLVGALLASLAVGSSVALPRFFDPACFFDWLDACQASWYTAVPAIHQAVLAMAPQHAAVLARRHLRFVRSTSDALPPTVMAALERVFDAPVVEAYAMTEASQIATNPLPPWVRKPGSVGLPAGPDVAILSEDGGFLPREAQGEICIRGETVMTAYEHNDDANLRAFHEGWLRTGDQGFFDADGYLRISGRLKEMINRGGEKVSPLEVEAILLRHAAIAEAAVFSVPHPTLGEAVAAAVVLHPGATIAESNLRQWLHGYLADIKVPQQIVVVDALPRGSTGKVERLLLADALQSSLRAAFVAPRTPTEHAVAEIWREVLGLERIGMLDNFMSMGGDSLKALMVISRLRQALGVKVALGELFARPVLAEFAEAVRAGARSTLPPITLAGRDEPLPLSFAQQRVWFLAQMEGVSQAYHVPLGLRLTGELDVGALRRALDRLVARHEALRTTFSHADGQPVQRIAAENGGFGLREHDLRQHSNAEGELQRLVVEEADTAFDLQTGPLIRGRLIRLGDSEHALLITMHHIVSDGWSMGVLTRELGRLYRAYSQGQADPLPALAIQYPDYAAWQRRWLTEDVLQAQSDFWQRVLAGAPAVLDLPNDRRRPVRQDHAGAFVTLELDDKLTAGLKALSQRHGTTLFMTLLAGWAALLARLSGQDDVVIGTPVANRSRAEVEPLIGFFVNTLALRLDLSGGPAVGELLQRVKARTLEAQQHQDLPFEQVVEIVRPARSLAHTPVFQVMFAWQNAGESDLELSGLTLASIRAPYSFAKFDLTLILAQVGGRIVGGLEYATALFDRTTVERHAGYLRRVLTAMVADDAQTADRLPLLSQAERHQLLTPWNATGVDYPRDKCVTAERFVADPFVEAADARMYKSGDLGRYLADGNIEFLGRNDFQVKIRGYRVELGEIEARLAQHPGVCEAVVLAREDGPGDKRLVAYYTVVPDSDEAGVEALRRHLSAVLPEYMVPAVYVRLDTLPLTANGKLDRQALPAPDGASYAARGYEAPAGEIEIRLAQIWADVLKLVRVGRHDNFFELGGHSLLAMRLVARAASTFDVKINVVTLFQAPTLRELAACLSGTEAPKEAWGIVQIQPLGDKTPIILINDTMIYQSSILGRKIGTDRRVLGIQLFDPINPRPLPRRSSLEEIVAEYVRLIREAQPRGPYILFGLCVGGVIAYEAAHQLRQAGAEVPLIVMADTWAPGHRKRLPFIQRFLLHWSDRFHVRKHTFGLIRSGKKPAAEALASYRRMRGGKIRHLLSALRKVDLEHGWFMPYLEEARDRYQAPASVDTVVMFQSDAFVTRFADPKMGWSDLVNDRLSVYRIPGWHVDMLQNEGAALIAEHLRPLLDRVDAERDCAVTAAL